MSLQSNADGEQQNIDNRSLERAAKILQALIYEYRRVAYDMSIASVERQGNDIFLKESENNLADKIIPGYDHVNSMSNLKPEDHKMILTIYFCLDNFIYFHEGCKIFLQDTGVAEKIGEAYLKPRPGPRSWTFEHPGGVSVGNLAGHGTYQVELKDGTQWAMDLTAAQNGHEKSLVPWKEYVVERVEKLRVINAFGHRRDMTFPDNHPSASDESMMMVAPKDEAETEKVKEWFLYQIADTMWTETQIVLRNHDMSARELLQSPEEQFESVHGLVISGAAEAMRNFKELTIAEMARARGEPIGPAMDIL